MDLRQLEAFVAVATLRSFRAAAARLNLTQPAVSSRIATLEAEIGERLLLRSGRPITLTDKGRRILSFAEQMLELSQHLTSHRGGLGRPTELVRIGVNSSLIKVNLADLTAYLTRRLPSLNIELQVDVSHRLVDRMMAGHLDLCLMHAPLDMIGIRRRLVLELPTIWVARPDTFPRPRLSLEELGRQLLVTFDQEAASYARVRSVLQRIGCWPARQITTNYADVIVTLVKNLHAVGTIARDFVRAEIARGELIEIDTELKLPNYQIYLCYSITPSGSLAKKVADLVVEFHAGPRTTLPSAPARRSRRER